MYKYVSEKNTECTLSNNFIGVDPAGLDDHVPPDFLTKVEQSIILAFLDFESYI